MAFVARPLRPGESVLAFFGAELRHWRELRGLSQEQLAAKVFVGKDTIRKVETADRRPSGDLAERLDDALSTGGALARLVELILGQSNGGMPSAAVQVAVCGSRVADADMTVIGEAVRGLAQLVMARSLAVRYGPIGVGIEVATFIADHYHSDDAVPVITPILGHANVPQGAAAMVIVGGGSGTRDEIALARLAGIRLIPVAASGGAARRAYELLSRDQQLRSWIPETDFGALGACSEADTIGEVVDRLLRLCEEEGQ